MSKQNFKIGKNFVPNILVLSCSAVLLLFGTLLAVSPVASHTNALVQTGEDGLSLVTNQVVDATIRPEENGSLSIIKDTVTGSTNSQYGYEIYISVNSDEVNDIYLNGNASNDGANQKINATTGTYDTPAALDLTNGATWGYAIAGLDNFDASYNINAPAASAKFAAMPTVENKQLIHEVTTAATDDETEIYYGIKADSTLEPGLYKTEILYTAVPKPAPRVAKAILGDNGNLNLVYDSLTYTVGENYTDNLNTPTEIVKVYDLLNDVTTYGIEGDSDIRDLITSINFEDSFHDFKPTSVAYWFSNMQNVSSITNIENFNTSEVIVAYSLFYYLGTNVSSLDFGNVGSLDFSKATVLDYMFGGIGANVTTPLELDLSGWNLSSANSINNIFEWLGQNAPSVTLDLTNWSVPNAVYASNIFRHTGDNADYIEINADGWNLANAVDIHEAFYCIGENGNGPISISAKNWNLPKAENLQDGFRDIGQNLYNADSTKEVVSIDVSGWTLGSLKSTHDAFYHVAYNASELSLVGLSDWDVSTVEDAKYTFQNMAWYVEDIDLEIKNWNLSSATDVEQIFYGVGYYAKTWNVDLSGWTFGDNITNSQYILSYAGFGDTSMTDWNLNVTNWTFGNNMDLNFAFGSMGYNADNWTITGLSTWNVSKVASFASAFDSAGYYATNWSFGNVGTWNVGNVTNMSRMFYGLGNHANTWSIGNLDNWNVGNVLDMSRMFADAGHDTTGTWTIGDISGWNVSNVTDMSSMFSNNAGYKATTWSIGDISGWNVANVTNHYSFIDYNSTSSNASTVDDQPSWPAQP